jgi:hypothetical protein
MDMAILSLSATIAVTSLFPSGGHDRWSAGVELRLTLVWRQTPHFRPAMGVVLETMLCRSAQTSRASTFEL